MTCSLECRQGLVSPHKSLLSRFFNRILRHVLFHNGQHENLMPQDHGLKRIDVTIKNLANDFLITGSERIILHSLESPD